MVSHEELHNWLKDILDRAPVGRGMFSLYAAATANVCFTQGGPPWLRTATAFHMGQAAQFMAQESADIHAEIVEMISRCTSTTTEKTVTR